MTGKADKEALAQFKDKFRFINEEEEPVLFESPASISGRSGVLYITCGHICFQSNYALLHETVVMVIVWKTVVSVQLGEDSVHLDSPIAEISGSSSNSSVSSLVDTFGKSVLVTLSGATPDYASRVFALMALLLQARYYQLLESDAPACSIVESHLSLENTVQRMKEVVLRCLKAEVAKSTEQAAASRVPKDYISIAIISYYEQNKNICPTAADAQPRETMVEQLSSSAGTDVSLLGSTPPSAPSSSLKLMSSSPARANSLPRTAEETHTGSIATDALLEWESEDVIERPSMSVGAASSTPPPPLPPPPPPPVASAHASPLPPAPAATLAPVAATDSSEKKPTKLQSNIQV